MVISEHDHQARNIGPNELMRLYGVTPDECVVVGQTAHVVFGDQHKDLVELEPRSDGYYTLVCSHCFADKGIDPQTEAEEIEQEDCLMEGGHFWETDDVSENKTQPGIFAKKINFNASLAPNQLTAAQYRQYIYGSGPKSKNPPTVIVSGVTV